MILNDLLNQQQLTQYRLAKQANIPLATLHDICSGKTRIEKCSAETIYKIAKALHVPMEVLLHGAVGDAAATQRELSYEYGLPEYLQHDLDAYKDGLKNGSTLFMGRAVRQHQFRPNR